MPWANSIFLACYLTLAGSSVDLKPGPEPTVGIEPLSKDVTDVTDKPGSLHDVRVDCSGSLLLPGQFLCNPMSHIDPATQQLEGCQRETERAKIVCQTAPGIICQETGNRTFSVEVPCKWTSGYDYDTALLLSIFMGFFGADRFYLGYPALGVLKFSTLGFFFLGHLLDIILIASQVVGPADGSNYVISYFGPLLSILGLDDQTTRKPQLDWF